MSCISTSTLTMNGLGVAGPQSKLNFDYRQHSDRDVETQSSRDNHVSRLDQKCEPPVNLSSQGHPYDSDSSDDRHHTVEIVNYQPSAVDHQSTTDFLACIRQYMYYPCDSEPASRPAPEPESVASYCSDNAGEEESQDEAFDSDWTHHTQVWPCSDPENCGDYKNEYWRPCSPNDDEKESGTPFIDSDSEVPAGEPQDNEEPYEGPKENEDAEEDNYASSDGDPGYDDQDVEEDNYASSDGAEGDDESPEAEDD